MLEENPFDNAQAKAILQEVKDAMAKSRHLKIRNQITGVVGIVATIAGASVATFGFFGHIPRDSGLTIDYRNDENDQDLKDMQLILQKQNDAIKTIQKQLSSLPNIQNNTELNILFGGLGQKLQNLEDREGKLEAAILQDPSKALAIPLLRRDLDNEKSSEHAELEAVKSDIDRVYDLFKWVCGSTALIGLGSVFSNLFGKKPGDQGSDIG